MLTHREQRQHSFWLELQSEQTGADGAGHRSSHCLQELLYICGKQSSTCLNLAKLVLWTTSCTVGKERSGVFYFLKCSQELSLKRECVCAQRLSGQQCVWFRGWTLYGPTWPLVQFCSQKYQSEPQAVSSIRVKVVVNICKYRSSRCFL